MPYIEHIDVPLLLGTTMSISVQFDSTLNSLCVDEVNAIDDPLVPPTLVARVCDIASNVYRLIQSRVLSYPALKCLCFVLFV